MLPLAADWLGTLPAWLMLGGLAVVGFFVWKGAGGTALRTLETANRILEKRVFDLEKQSKEDAKTIATLTGKTDMALAVKPFMEWAVTHETRAMERHNATVAVLTMIADRLGPDPGST